MLADLAALTPPLVVAGAFLIGLFVFLRRQMSAGNRPAAGGSAGIPEDARNTDAGEPAPGPSPDQPKV
ncbi:MAG TPA: hypothetical protein VIV12_13060 [Streptosporangiaceae bacterium]